MSHTMVSRVLTVFLLCTTQAWSADLPELNVISGVVMREVMDGPCGSVKFQVRVHQPSATAVSTAVLLSGLPGDILWFDKYAGKADPTSPTGFSYDSATNGYQIGLRLFQAGFRVVETQWDPRNAPVTHACAGRSTAFGDAYGYSQRMIKRIFEHFKVPADQRYLVGHSWGAMTIGALEVPSNFVKVQRSVQIAPSGADVKAGCHTERDVSRPSCATDPLHCRYIGGWQYFFPLSQTDNYDLDAKGVFNPFLAAKQIFGLPKNCHDAVHADPKFDSVFIANSIYPQLTKQGVTRLDSGSLPNGTGHSSLVIYGEYDWGEGSIRSYLKGRTALFGPGPAPIVVPKKGHGFNGWPSSSVDSIIRHILGQTQ